jgi:hypothetical protein
MNKVMAIFWAIGFLIISACAAQKSQQEIASDFWAAMMADDIAKARTFAKQGSMDNVTPKESAKMEKVEIRHAREENGLTYVPTTMIGMENGKPKRLTFDTIMEKEGGEWKVDFDKTSTSIIGVSMDAAMDGMGKAMGKAMGEAMQGVGEAVNKGLQKNPLAP